MSVILKKPFIETVVGSLSGTQIGYLADAVNGTGDVVTAKIGTVTFTALKDEHSGIHRINLILNGGNSLPGFLIYTNSYCVMISYIGSSVKLLLTNIDLVTFKTTDIEENLDIEELRRVINDTLIEKGEAVSVQVDDIDSESSTAGQVIMSDGEGGAEWTTPAGGTKLYKHHIVLNEDDDSIDIISPVSTQIVTDTDLFTSNAVLIAADLPSRQMNGVAIVGSDLITEYQGQLSTYSVPDDFESDTVTEL